MKILFLTQVLPYPLDAGPKIRAYYVLRHLAQHHEITLVSFVRASDTPEAIAHLQEFCTAVHTVTMPRAKLLDAFHLLRSLVTGQPFIMARDSVAAMRRLLSQLLADASFDAVHADQLWMAPYALWVQQIAGADAPIKTVLDQHNAVYMIPQRLAQGERNPLKRLLMALETRKLVRYEIETCCRFDAAVWVTQEDYDAVSQQAAADREIPNAGIIPICGAPSEVPTTPRQPHARRITFVGGLHYPPNAQGILWFATHVFPQVLARVPDAVLTVIGKSPPAALYKLGIPPANLDVAGFVADLDEYLQETAVFVVPLQAGGGMRVKILDAWTWGMPIVSTTVGAEGTENCPGENILIEDVPDQFARSTIQLLQEPTRRERLASAGRAWVEQRYNWRTTYRAWDRIYTPHLHREHSVQQST